MEHQDESLLLKMESPLTLIFVRHAEADSHGPIGLEKDDDPPLTALGQRQAGRVARRLQKETFAHVYVSPALRAHDTAEAIMKHHKTTPMTVVKEIDEISRDHFITVPAGFHPANKETMRRERTGLDKFVNRLRHSHKPGERVLVVAHGNLIRTLMPVLAGRPPLKSMLMDVNNASVSIVEVWRSGSAVLRLANCVKHLLSGEVT